MDIKAILTEHGIEAEAMGKLSKAIETAVGNEFVEKQRYKDKLGEIETLKTSLKTAEDTATTAESYKTKYETEVTAHTVTKTGYETEKATATKSVKLEKVLVEKYGANPKYAAKMAKEFKFDDLKDDGEGFKDFDKLIEPVKTEWADMFGTTTTTGAKVFDNPMWGGVDGDAKSMSETATALNAHRITK